MYLLMRWEGKTGAAYEERVVSAKIVWVAFLFVYMYVDVLICTCINCYMKPRLGENVYIFRK